MTAAALAAILGGCAHREHRSAAGPPPDLAASEARSDVGMVASGSVEATRAGVRILEQGGNAVDAAVACAFALGAADPGGSGLGGMSYVLIFMADGRAVAIDGTAPAPLAVNPPRLQRLRVADQIRGPEFVAVPSSLAALGRALELFGSMTLAEVLAPAIEIAEIGARLTTNHVTWLGTYREPILASGYLRFVVLANGENIGRPGERFCRPDLARTLRRIAKEGVDSFYRGSIADEIVTDMANRGGFIKKIDLGSFRVRELRPLRASYRDVEILSFPPPGAGGAVIEVLNIIETWPSSFLAEDTVERLQVLVEAFRLAAADRRRLGPDPNTRGWIELPNLSDEFAMQRAALIIPGRAIPEAELTSAAGFNPLGEYTTHVSVADREGNAVALTQTLGRQYGAKIATPGLGFPYNSLLESFDFENPESRGYVRPRGRYPTDMAPTIVLRDGVPVLVLGSAGSERIPPVIAQVVSQMVDRDLGVRDAVVAPRVLWGGHDPPKVYLEIASPVSENDADTLESFGYENIYRLRFPPRPIDLTFFGGVNAVAFKPRTGEFTGVGDPRRRGFAVGPRGGTRRLSTRVDGGNRRPRRFTQTEGIDRVGHENGPTDHATESLQIHRPLAFRSCARGNGCRCVLAAEAAPRRHP